MPDSVPARRRPGPARVAALAVLGVVVGLGLWAAVQARTAQDEARAAEGALRAAERALDDGDLEAAAAAARESAAATGRARSAGDALPLRLTQALPWVGDDVEAARTTLAATDDAVSGAVVPLAEGALLLVEAQGDAPTGQVDVEAVSAFAQVVREASSVASRSRTAVDALPQDGLDLVGGTVGTAAEGLRVVDDRLTTADAAAQVAVETLGADRPRTYLVAAQNLAEARPTGGIIGSWALLTIDAGRVSLAGTGVNDDLENLRADQLPDLPDDVEALYGPDLALSQNVNLSPDFPQAATLLVRLWTEQGRPAPDGVIGMDPVALARVLGATGPVQAAGGPQLDSGNLVGIVQQEAYSTFEDRTAERQAYLGAVTAAVFDGLVGADWTDPALRRALTGSVRDGHLQMWSADPATQDLLVDLGAAGALGAPDDATVRLHLTNADASKLDQFLSVSATSTCTPDGIEVAADLTSSPPTRLPEYSRSHVDGLDPYTHRVTVALYLPPTRGLAGLTVDGATRLVAAGSEQGWTVLRTTVDIAPGQTARLRWLLSGSGTAPRLQLQPLTTEPEIRQPDEVAGCS